MVITDDERRYVAANQAACLLLRLREEDVVRLRIDDLTPPESRPIAEALWDNFLRAGVQEGTYELMTPDGARLPIEYSATANVEPGRHLSILMFPPGEALQQPAAHEPRVLTNREREVLGMVAMGRGTAWIARELGISTSTVETHVRNCLEKLGARNRAHAIALGLEKNEIELDLGSAVPR